jgi:hypothetical protein
MDEFGTFTASREDMDELAQGLRDQGNILFAYSPNQIDCYIISINQEFKVLGEMPFGGNPRGKALISILGRGFFHFDLGSQNFHIQPEYVSEKLGLASQDATYITELLLALNCRLVTIPFGE